MKELLARCPVVPVVVLDDPAQARPLGRALLAGGIDVVEVTLRTPAGLPGIRELSSLPGLVVGAGSVLVSGHVDQVADAGAEFVVSPGVSREVLARSAERGLPALPGVATATDLMTVAALGLTEVKFFPANLLGGPAGIRALAAPFGGFSFLPSGGVNPATMADYLAVPEVPAVSGTWMVERALLREQRWAEVTERSAAAVALARSR
ncbi:bifunctional 4-hydroxy-2-oxoglutarate aldolase/2-dehydro-3-deoxy-phosphogluconate aldolase [Amycolatopsis sp. K13G38]|uniref:2-dehydro-3-deoxy-phosphogluconate aldolase n=1 Tax=Amycolatopsis acididurans TaxID=2724524 RepID=A0ABX1J3Y1_9PSEU|nr:bifunctional 4-hydroxy-2-oxoglutarate aldolase/2-dehydro-3-deoxy-phosphogluconate aldolase [Amycolatopsis acididurans]NKQ54498.1 bifunctional 4-hydroxy-2-oxoglutarate aldolase/2-dehydro-3-deoxy-phosphogluconate aldolase [Amycolatopsis acididurans]